MTNHIEQIETIRASLFADIGERRAATVRRIEENRRAAADAWKLAQHHGERGEIRESAAARARCDALQASILADEGLLRDLERERESVASGKHSEFIPAMMAAAAAALPSARLHAARIGFETAVTRELINSARRYRDELNAAGAPLPALVELLASHGG